MLAATAASTQQEREEALGLSACGGEGAGHKALGAGGWRPGCCRRSARLHGTHPTWGVLSRATLTFSSTKPAPDSKGREESHAGPHETPGASGLGAGSGL